MTPRALLRILNKPEYLFRPTQVFKRVKNLRTLRGCSTASISTVWGIDIRAFPSDQIGDAIAKMGFYDLTVVEAIMRTGDAGEICVDVGAHIGFTALAMALAAGRTGQIFAYEPVPSVYDVLNFNVEAWRSDSRMASIKAKRFALSDAEGEFAINVPSDLSTRAGHASLSVAFEGGYTEMVKVKTLGSEFKEQIGLLKVDVEGHERQVLDGGEDLFRKQLIRDVIYEDHGGYPSETSACLESFGYIIYTLTKSLIGPVLTPVVRGQSYRYQAYETPNFIATVDRLRLERRLAPRGWQALRS